MPTIGCHSTIDSPECVSRVTPPTTIIANTSAQQTKSHAATGRPRSRARSSRVREMGRRGAAQREVGMTRILPREPRARTGSRDATLRPPSRVSGIIERCPPAAITPQSDLVTDRPRLIAHLDMDAFYASVELLRHPELRGKAVVIGGGRHAAAGDARETFTTLRDYVGRGVATTATYEARALGVHSGMGLMKAARLAPDAIRLPADFDAYRRYSRLFKEAVATIAPRIEDRGIDEIYIDLTDVDPPATSARDGAMPTRSPTYARSRNRSRTRCARRPDCRRRSASRRTSCSRRSPPSSTSPTA